MRSQFILIFFLRMIVTFKFKQNKVKISGGRKLPEVRNMSYLRGF